MRIVQITDLHVGREGEDTYGVNVRENFLKVLEAAQEIHPQHLVLSGDLCYRQGDPDIYRWMRQQLDEKGIPYDIISGNHDDPVMMAHIFERQALLKNSELYFMRYWEGRPIIFLDTTIGEVSETQLDWLKEVLHPHQQEILLFMHHPPLLGGVPFMDNKHSLRNSEAVQQILFEHPYNINIFTGHYHVEKVIRKRNILVHITPSCFFQIGQQSAEFEVDHYRIGFRAIEWNNGVMMNTVHYL